MRNKISKEYLIKLRYFFVFRWIVLGVTILLLIYSLISYFELFTFDTIPWKLAFIIGLVLSLISIPQYFITEKIRTRLIFKIIEDRDFITLITFNKSIINIDKNLLPLQKNEPLDYFINTLLSHRSGIFNDSSEKSQASIIKINGKKYYLIPNIFESEVML